MLRDKGDSDTQRITIVTLSGIGKVHKLQNVPLDITEVFDCYQDTIL